ncbi:MAG: DNA polymerase, partial [Acidimicrobiia bacterium]
MPTLALLDGHSLAYRAFFALPEDLATTSGQQTNAVYGFTRMLVRLLNDHHPDGLAVAWDVSRSTFRSETYPEYKAQRLSAPDAFHSQLPLIHEVLSALQIPQLQQEGYEADDVIASLAERAIADGWHVLLVTGDRDAFQLVGDHLTVVYTRRGISDIVLADAAYVEQRYGIRPDQYVDYAALRGDTSDNLPGAPGVGEKTAARLVSGYGTLEGIFEHLEDQTPRLRESLAAHRDQVFLNRLLMRLVRDLEPGVEPDDLHRVEWDRQQVKLLFDSLEFHSLWEDLIQALPPAAGEVGEVLEVATAIRANPGEVAHLSGLRPLVLEAIFDGDLWGVAVATGSDRAAAVSLDALAPLHPALADPGHPKVAHNAKELIRSLLAIGIPFDGLQTDTALAAYVLNPATRTYDLDEVAGRYLGVEVSSPDPERASGVQGALDLSGTGGPDLESGGRRAVVVAALAERLQAELHTRQEASLFEEMEVPLVAVLARMEHIGIGVDREYLEELGESLRDRLATLERAIHEAAGEPFNVNSTTQLREVLFSRLGLPVLKKTSTGQPSTDASVLDKLAEAHPIVEHLLRYRELEKLRSTYVDGFLPLITSSGRIHTRFNQMAAATGRLSSDTPNLQNIPVRSETGRTVRRAFVPRPGWTFVVADYSQIELRVLAHMSADPGLLEAFEGEETDIHTAT